MKHVVAFLWVFLFYTPSLVTAQEPTRSALEHKLNSLLLLDKTSSPVVFTNTSFTILDTAGFPEASYDYSQINDLRRWIELNPSDTGWYGLHGIPKISKAGVIKDTTGKNPFEGLRIAIDPGHTSGNFEEAQAEKKFVHIWHRNKEYRLIEAKLNLATALLLEDTLKKLGATVFLTRRDAGNSDGLSFKEWKKSQVKSSVQNELSRQRIDSTRAAFLLTEATDRDLFLLYNNLDLEHRALKINNFAPDLAIMIHYNVDVDNEPWETTTQRNYSMAFVPGAFARDELLRKEDRRNLIRLLVTEIPERSILLGRFTEKAFVEKLGVEQAPDSGIIYLDKFSKKTGTAGVFSRNLSMTRLVNAPLVYGEPLYQDHKNEITRLGKIDGWIGRESWNVRLKEVSEAYLQGVTDYVQKVQIN